MDPTPFLEVLSRRPFEWGQTDCALVLADYAMWARRLNQDPAEDLRGTYATEAECRRLLEEHGGVLRLVGRIAREIRAERVHGSPPVGAFGVVRYGPKGGRITHYGAIRTLGDRWAIKRSDYVIFTSRARVAAAWSL